MKSAQSKVLTILHLKKLVSVSHTLSELLAPFLDEILGAIRTVLSHEMLDSIKTEIDQIICPELNLRKIKVSHNERNNAVKPGFSGLLDVARITLSESSDDVYEWFNIFKLQYSFPIKLKFDHTNGFTLSVRNDEIVEFPAEFLNINRKKSITSFTTMEIVKYT